MLNLFDEKKLHSINDRTFPMSEGRDAQKYLMERKQFGKVLLLND